MMSLPASAEGKSLLRRGRGLERFTLVWNVVGVIVLAVLAIMASSVALAGFGSDSFIEIGASTVVLWELSGTGEARHHDPGNDPAARHTDHDPVTIDQSP